MILGIASLLMFLFLLRLGYGIYLSIEKPAFSNSEKTEENPLSKGWNDPEIQNIKKEMYWLEQQLVLAKSDSISLGFDLSDSLVQVQLKGTVLFQAKYLHMYPKVFLHSLNADNYLDFAKASSISNEKSSIVKKPIKRVAAPGSEAARNEIKQDSVTDRRLEWQFNTTNGIRVVIFGVEMNPDSTLSLQPGKDLFAYRLRQLPENIFPKVYQPELFIWLNDRNARAVYRAHPENGRIVFRN